jgi:hypothetical protein
MGDGMVGDHKGRPYRVSGRGLVPALLTKAWMGDGMVGDHKGRPYHH